MRIKLGALVLVVLVLAPAMLDFVKLAGDFYSNYEYEFHSSHDYVAGVEVDPLLFRLFSVHGETSQQQFWAFFVAKVSMAVIGVRLVIRWQRGKESAKEQVGSEVS